jgi:beta-glucosidase/6-phospho-beta-glucosidase/beta-galactosidase
MGLNSLRLSVNWARIEPEDGVFNSFAIERYRDMLYSLIERNIKPMVCLLISPIHSGLKKRRLSRSLLYPGFHTFAKFVVA